MLVVVISCARILTRVLVGIHEDASWDGFWFTPTPVGVVVPMVGVMQVFSRGL